MRLMGKRRVTQLLHQLKTNQQQELHNAAAIYTVAQVAVNELQEQSQDSTNAALPPAPSLDKAELLRRYSSYNGCRTAAKNKGIKFQQTPSWQQLITAFGYAEACQQLLHIYTEAYPRPELQGVTIELPLG